MVQEGFASAAHAVAQDMLPLTEPAAQAFLEQWPLDAIFRELSSPAISATTLADAAQLLAKLFATSAGAALLPTVLPYAAAALQSAAPALRRLAVQQLGRLLPAGPAAGSAPQQAEQRQEATQLLVRALSDEEVGVAADAEAALVQLAAPPAPHLGLLLDRSAAGAAGAELARLSASADPLLRMRSLTLLVRLAAQSPTAAQAVAASGLLEPLLHELQDPDDLLSCMAALQLVRDAAEQCDAGMAVQLQAAVAPRLAALLQHPEPVLQSGALRAAASLLSAALEAGQGPMAVDGAAVEAGAAAAGNGLGGSGGGDAAQALLGALKAVLDVGGRQEFAAELEDAALDAVGILGLHASGAEALLTSAAAASLAGDVAYKALGRPPSPSQRLAALHALASLAGAERPGRSGKLLSSEAEAALRVAVFEGAGAAWAGATPGEVLQQQLEQPFLEQRVAVYRCLAALAARDWAAGQVAAHAPLLAFLLNPQSESSKQGAEWRHAAVSALAATCGDVLAGGVGAGGPFHAVLAGVAPRVQAAAAAGPYGREGHLEEHVVATHTG